MIFNLDGLAAMVWAKTRSFRNRPTFQHTVPSEPEVIVVFSRVMFLYAERLLTGDPKVGFHLFGILEFSRRVITKRRNIETIVFRTKEWKLVNSAFDSA